MKKNAAVFRPVPVTVTVTRVPVSKNTLVGDDVVRRRGSTRHIAIIIEEFGLGRTGITETRAVPPFFFRCFDAFPFIVGYKYPASCPHILLLLLRPFLPLALHILRLYYTIYTHQRLKIILILRFSLISSVSLRPRLSLSQAIRLFQPIIHYLDPERKKHFSRVKFAPRFYRILQAHAAPFAHTHKL